VTADVKVISADVKAVSVDAKASVVRRFGMSTADPDDESGDVDQGDENEEGDY
jgi:hypothetical protein